MFAEYRDKPSSDRPTVTSRALCGIGRIVLMLGLMAGFSPATAAWGESFYVDGSGGVPLAVTVTGPDDGPEILFIHGLGHARASYGPQMSSWLADRYRMVAFDLRGHGQSGKPARDEDYADPAIWAEDAKSVMAAANLSRPILVGWSYGGYVAADIIRTFGSESISGLILVNTTGGLVSVAPSDSPMPADLAEAYALLADPTYANQKRAVDIVSRYLVAGEAAPGWLEQSREIGLMLPPFVRSRLRAHHVRNADLSSEITVPVLIAYGAKDTSLSPDVVAALRRAIPGSEESRYEDAGHSPFAEDVERFNRELAAFADQHWQKGKP